ncbi:MAG: adenylyl-sulfate kinase [Bdellovibrio bacteriovorus]
MTLADAIHHEQPPVDRTWKPLLRKRILVCGKGGSGKSTLVALLAAVLQDKGYGVMVLDGDASNPEGLVRLLFGVGVQDEPKPLIEFFGGIERVTCPVDDPSPLRRIGDGDPVPERPINLAREVGPEYSLERGSLRLLQAGKIETYGQGCDGPLEKVVRDFLIEDAVVSLIDEKAGVEHFGRRIPDRMDIILGILDCTRESVSIARRISGFAKEMQTESAWFVLNKAESQAMKAEMLDLLGELGTRVIGSVPYISGLAETALSGRPLNEYLVSRPVESIVARLEAIAAGQRGLADGDER